MSRPKVVAIRGELGAAAVIRQEDLVELELLRQEARKASKAFRSRRAEIRQAIERGARVEPGLRGVEIQTRAVMLLR